MSLQGEVEEVVAAALPENVDDWCKGYDHRKIVHDALWGTFPLQRHEVALLDTPLLQRLRFIRQTGAVYATYPSALHTRFEHTLGVVHQVSKLCSALVANRNERRIDTTLEDNLRFGALLHDTGHGPFSHTSEQFFSSLDDIAEVKEADARFRDSGAGEVLSALITESTPMRNFVDAINNKYRTGLKCDLISELITGSVGPSQMYLSEIVHGPFDADKLDYMPRDGMFSGLKMHVDLDRLYNSIDITSAEGMTRLVGSVAGISPLMQIMFNKMLLFTGMYHHHKVRAADCMLWAMFQIAIDEGAKLGGRQLAGAVDFLRITDDQVLIPELTDHPEIEKLIQQIRTRRLWKRALVISRRTVPESMHNQAGDSTHGLFPAFVALAGNSRQKIRRRRALSDHIWEASNKVCERHEVWLDIPSRPSMDEAKRMWIRAPGNESPQTLGDFIPIAQWVELYGMHQWRAHVFCPEAHRAVVGKAAERVLRDEFGLELLSTAQAYAHAKDA